MTRKAGIVRSYAYTPLHARVSRNKIARLKVSLGELRDEKG